MKRHAFLDYARAGVLAVSIPILATQSFAGDISKKITELYSKTQKAESEGKNKIETRYGTMNIDRKASTYTLRFNDNKDNNESKTEYTLSLKEDANNKRELILKVMKYENHKPKKEILIKDENADGTIEKAIEGEVFGGISVSQWGPAIEPNKIYSNTIDEAVKRLGR